MAEYHGFFEAIWDENVYNPITEEYTGWWDIAYLWKDFMNYFALFVGNGVFASPTNQLKVMAGQGMSVVVRPGWAFINGHWYHNDTDKVLMIPYNSATSSRIDSVKVRLSEADRTILALEFADETDVIRGENVYDLKLAEIIVQPGATSISDAWITDTRPNEAVCGFVKGLMDVITTADLFEQYNAIFNEWFDTVKDQVTGDLAIRLQAEFEQINEDIQAYKELVDAYYEKVGEDIEQYKNDLQTIVDDYKEDLQGTVDEAKEIVADFVDKDFVIPLQTLNFSNKQCTVLNDKITPDTLVDVYFTADTIKEAEECQVYVDSATGKIILHAEKQPESVLKAVIRVRVR